MVTSERGEVSQEKHRPGTLGVAKKSIKRHVVLFDYFQPVLFNLSRRSGVNVYVAK